MATIDYVDPRTGEVTKSGVYDPITGTIEWTDSDLRAVGILGYHENRPIISADPSTATAATQGLMSTLQNRLATPNAAGYWGGNSIQGLINAEMPKGTYQFSPVGNVPGANKSWTGLAEPPAAVASTYMDAPKAVAGWQAAGSPLPGFSLTNFYHNPDEDAYKNDVKPGYLNRREAAFGDTAYTIGNAPQQHVYGFDGRVAPQANPYSVTVDPVAAFGLHDEMLTEAPDAITQAAVDAGTLEQGLAQNTAFDPTFGQSAGLGLRGPAAPFTEHYQDLTQDAPSLWGGIGSLPGMAIDAAKAPVEGLFGMFSPQSAPTPAPPSAPPSVPPLGMPPAEAPPTPAVPPGVNIEMLNAVPTPAPSPLNPAANARVAGAFDAPPAAPADAFNGFQYGTAMPPGTSLAGPPATGFSAARMAQAASMLPDGYVQQETPYPVQPVEQTPLAAPAVPAPPAAPIESIIGSVQESLNNPLGDAAFNAETAAIREEADRRFAMAPMDMGVGRPPGGYTGFSPLSPMGMGIGRPPGGLPAAPSTAAPLGNPEDTFGLGMALNVAPENYAVARSIPSLAAGVPVAPGQTFGFGQPLGPMSMFSGQNAALAGNTAMPSGFMDTPENLRAQMANYVALTPEEQGPQLPSDPLQAPPNLGDLARQQLGLMPELDDRLIADSIIADTPVPSIPATPTFVDPAQPTSVSQSISANNWGGMYATPPSADQFSGLYSAPATPPGMSLPETPSLAPQAMLDNIAMAQPPEARPAPLGTQDFSLPAQPLSVSAGNLPGMYNATPPAPPTDLANVIGMGQTAGLSAIGMPAPPQSLRDINPPAISPTVDQFAYDTPAAPPGMTMPAAPVAPAAPAPTVTQSVTSPAVDAAFQAAPQPALSAPVTGAADQLNNGPPTAARLADAKAAIAAATPAATPPSQQQALDDIVAKVAPLEAPVAAPTPASSPLAGVGQAIAATPASDPASLPTATPAAANAIASAATTTPTSPIGPIGGGWSVSPIAQAGPAPSPEQVATQMQGLAAVAAMAAPQAAPPATPPSAPELGMPVAPAAPAVPQAPAAPASPPAPELGRPVGDLPGPQTAPQTPAQQPGISVESPEVQSPSPFSGGFTPGQPTFGGGPLAINEAGDYAMKSMGPDYDGAGGINTRAIEARAYGVDLSPIGAAASSLFGGFDSAFPGAPSPPGPLSGTYSTDTMAGGSGTDTMGGGGDIFGGFGGFGGFGSDYVGIGGDGGGGDAGYDGGASNEGNYADLGGGGVDDGYDGYSDDDDYGW